jgi:hypothetical protein
VEPYLGLVNRRSNARKRPSLERTPARNRFGTRTKGRSQGDRPGSLSAENLHNRRGGGMRKKGRARPGCQVPDALLKVSESRRRIPASCPFPKSIVWPIRIQTLPLRPIAAHGRTVSVQSVPDNGPMPTGLADSRIQPRLKAIAAWQQRPRRSGAGKCMGRFGQASAACPWWTYFHQNRSNSQSVETTFHFRHAKMLLSTVPPQRRARPEKWPGLRRNRLPLLFRPNPSCGNLNWRSSLDGHKQNRQEVRTI